MDFNRPKKTRVLIDNSLSCKYPHDLNMYKQPVDAQITLNEFEELAIERLKVLRILELASLKGAKFEDWTNMVLTELSRQGLTSYRKLFTGTGIDPSNEKLCQEQYEMRQKDHISHFILRFVYCQSEEYRRWFVTRELELFKLRWSYLTTEGKKMFLKMNEFEYTPVDAETARELDLGFGEHYQVKWTDVVELVRTRKVRLDRGRAFITAEQLIWVLGAVFRTNLAYVLTTMFSKLDIIHGDERLKRLMKNLHGSYTGKRYTSNDGNKRVTLHSIDSLSKTSFPLCMKQMHNTLKTHHHLKHWARQQFGLFLKGIGLSLEDAVTFWRTEFTKKPEIDLDTFEKKYAYGVRYNYGKEGKRTNYTPYSCGKIINSAPGPGDFHGCPFKNNSVQSLKQSFASQKMSDVEISEVLNFVNANQYQLACTKYFEITHRAPLTSGVVNHPNQYFEDSTNILGVGKSDAPSTRSSNTNTQAVASTSEPASSSTTEFMDDAAFDTADFDQLPG